MRDLINPKAVRKLFDERVKASRLAANEAKKAKYKQVKKEIVSRENLIRSYYEQEAVVRDVFAKLNLEISELNKISAKLGNGPVDVADLVKHRMFSQQTIDNEYYIENKSLSAVNPKFRDVRLKPYAQIKAGSALGSDQPSAFEK